MSWRPEKGWAHQRSVYFEKNQPAKPHHTTRQKDYEAGADAMLEALCTKENYMEWEDEFENLSGIQHKSFKGWLAAIPYEETKNERD